MVESTEERPGVGLDHLIKTHFLRSAPESPIIQADEFVALGEDRLFPTEARRILDQLREDDDARVEFMGLFPARYQEIFGHLEFLAEPVAPEPQAPVEAAPAPVEAAPITPPSSGGARVLTFRQKAVAAVAALAAAAVVTFLVRPASDPGLTRPASISAAVIARTRGAHSGGEGLFLMSTGDQLEINVTLPGRADGAPTWGALLQVDESGKAVRLCSTTDPGSPCTVGPETMTHRYVAKGVGSRRWFTLVTADSADVEAELTQLLKVPLETQGPEARAAELVERLKAAKARTGWQIDALPEATTRQ